jgi:hypothetical protein
MCALLLPDITSFIAAMLFSVHPIHTEAVSILFFLFPNHHKSLKFIFLVFLIVLYISFKSSQAYHIEKN